MADFDGSTYDPERDGERLRTQFLRVRELMFDGKWRTLKQIAAYAEGSEAAVSARLRDLRKRKFGGYVVEREYVDNGIWQYRVPSGQTRTA